MAPYLPRCLDSLLAQTHRELEVVVVDDGSTDGGGATCDAYAARDPRVRAIHQPNRGLSAARNAGLDAARGELVGFVDSDDWVEPDHFELLAARLEQAGADIVVCGCQRIFQDAAFARRTCSDKEFSGRWDALRALSEGQLYHVVWDKLYRRELFDGLAFSEGRTFEDVLITYRLLMRARLVVCLDTCSYHQIARASSIGHTSSHAVEDFAAHLEMLRDLQSQANPDTIPQDIIRNFFVETAGFAYRTLFQDFVSCRQRRPALFAQAKGFWLANRGSIEAISPIYWAALRFPAPFRAKGYAKARLPHLWEALRKLRGTLAGRETGKLFD